MRDDNIESLDGVDERGLEALRRWMNRYYLWAERTAYRTGDAGELRIAGRALNAVRAAADGRPEELAAYLRGAEA